MDQEILWQQFTALPSDAQRQVVDFIVFLATRYRPVRPSNQAHERDLTTEPIIGMWADRDDLADSSMWVEATREREWECRRG